MNKWTDTLDVSSVWSTSGEDEEIIPGLPKIAALVKLKWETDYPEDGLLGQIVRDLTYWAKEGGIDEFNYVWDELYDWADDNGVWIKTRS